MKLQQLRYAVEVWRHNLNVSDAAAALYTSQPGVSKQIRLLEEELGVPLFVRSGKRIVSVTAAGESVLATAAQILRDVQNIKSIGSSFSDKLPGSLTLAATPTHLRFRLPQTLAAFKNAHPDIKIALKCVAAERAAKMVANGEADLALVHDLSDADAEEQEVRRLSCGRWRYGLLLPRDHRLAAGGTCTLADLAEQPLIRYDCPDAGSSFARAFARLRPLRPHFVLDAADAQTAALYVRMGLGLALMDFQAASQVAGDDLSVLDIGDCFESAEACFMLRADTLMRPYHYDLIALHCPDLPQSRVEQLLHGPAVEDFSI